MNEWINEWMSSDRPANRPETEQIEMNYEK